MITNDFSININFRLNIQNTNINMLLQKTFEVYINWCIQNIRYNNNQHKKVLFKCDMNQI